MKEKKHPETKNQDEKTKRQLIGAMIILSVFIFFVAIGIYFEKSSNENALINTQISAENSRKIEGAEVVKSFTLAEVFKKNTAENCWIVVSDRVYDITSYIAGNTHPGGQKSLTESCGSVSTTFERIHSPSTQRALERFFVGVVK